MEFINEALAAAPAVVLVLTELLKLVPVKFTSNHAAWVNGILSLVAAVLVVKPQFNLEDVAATAGSALFIAVVAAVAYNQFTSKLVKLNKEA